MPVGHLDTIPAHLDTASGKELAYSMTKPESLDDRIFSKIEFSITESFSEKPEIPVQEIRSREDSDVECFKRSEKCIETTGGTVIVLYSV